MKIPNYTKGLIFAIGEVFCFSILETMGVLSFNSGATPMTIITVRFTIATILFGLTILAWKSSLFKIAKEDIKLFVISGVVLLVETLIYWQSLKVLSSISLLLTLYYLCPLWTVLIFVFFKRRKFNKKIWLSVGLSVAGVALSSQLIPNGAKDLNIPGMSLALLGGFLWAVYFISIQRVVSKYHPFTLLFYSFAIVAFVSLFMQNPSVTLSQLTPNAIKILAVLAVVNTFLAYILLSLAVYFNKAVKSNILDALVMPMSIGLAFLILGQAITIWQGVGIIMIVSVTYLLKTNAKNSNTTE